MAFKERITGFLSMFTKEVRTFNAGEVTPKDNLPFLPTWFWQSPYGVPRGIDYEELRKYAKSPWVQMVKSAIKKQIMSIEWDVVPTEEDEEGNEIEKYEEDINKIKTLLKYPNRNGDTFWSLWGAFLDDVLDIDAGVIFKGFNRANELVELFPYDGARFLIGMDEHGLIERYYQYSFQYPQNQPIPFEKEEVIYGKMGSNTDQFPYGWAPLQSIQQEVELMIQSTRWNKEMFKNDAVPDLLVGLNANPDDLDRFKQGWLKAARDRVRKIFFHNTPDLKVEKLAMTNKDMEWLEGQKWFFHTIFAAYGLSPQEVGYYEDSNRATGESQERISVKNAIKPYITLIEDKINREIIPVLIGHDEVMFKFFPKDDVAEKIEHDQMMAKLTANVLTINEVRAMEGRDPVDWGDQPMMMAMQEMAMENESNNDNNGKDNPKDEKRDIKDKDEDKESKEDREKARKLYTKLFEGFMKSG